MRPKILHALRILAVTAALVWLLWLVLANVWLNLGLVGKPMLSISDAEVRLGRAFSWWPGKVRGRDLRIVVHDSSVELELRVDHFDLAFSLRELMSKQLHTTQARLRGVSLRVRGTRVVPELCMMPPGLPPIFGLALPVAASLKDCLAQRETAKFKGPPPQVEKLFHFRLENLDVQGMREVWIETYRLEGNVALRGTWSFWPKKELQLELPDLEMHDAQVAQGARKLVHDLDLTLGGNIEPLPLGDLDQKTLWRSVSARAALRLESLELKSIRGALLALDPIAPPSLPPLDGLANVKSAIRLDSGHVKSFALEAQASDAAIGLLDRRIEGALRLRAHLREDPDHGGQLVVTNTRLTIDKPRLRQGSETQVFDDTTITVDGVGAGRLDPEHQRLSLDFSATVSRLKLLIALIPGGLPHTIAKLLLHDDDPATATGALHATAHGAEVRGFHAGADGLTLDGGFGFAPKLDGKLTAKYGVISADIPLSP